MTRANGSLASAWSDRTLAVFGESYVGYAALAAAASGHPSIRAAALRNTTTDIAGDWLRHQGVLRLEFLTIWSLAAWCGSDGIDAGSRLDHPAAQRPSAGRSRRTVFRPSSTGGRGSTGSTAVCPGGRQWPVADLQAAGPGALHRWLVGPLHPR